MFGSMLSVSQMAYFPYYDHVTERSFSSFGSYPKASRVIDPDPYLCPLCAQHGLIRIQRRLIDRLLSFFVRQRRFRCTQPGCSWEGNLREKTARRQSWREKEKLSS